MNIRETDQPAAQTKQWKLMQKCLRNEETFRAAVWSVCQNENIIIYKSWMWRWLIIHNFQLWIRKDSTASVFLSKIIVVWILISEWISDWSDKSSMSFLYLCI